MVPSKPRSTVSPSDVIVITCSSTHDAAHLSPLPKYSMSTISLEEIHPKHMYKVHTHKDRDCGSWPFMSAPWDVKLRNLPQAANESPTRANRQGEAVHSPIGSESHPSPVFPSRVTVVPGNVCSIGKVGSCGVELGGDVLEKIK